jgi:drug/metabolite transporter (DMT)-like permease
VFACLTAACFGGLGVATYKGISWNADIRRGAAAMNGVAFVTELALALLAGERLSDLRAGVWPFVIAGAVAPGASQILMLGAVREIGPARATMLLGASPVLAAVIAIVFLKEPFRVALALGTAAVVAGVVVLARERGRAESFFRVGTLLALACALLYAARDNIFRWSERGAATVPPLLGAAVSLGTGALVLAVWALATRRPSHESRFPVLVAYAPAGLLVALAYAALVTALDRGRVTVVSPLTATQGLWAVLFAWLVLGRTEAIGRRIVLSATLLLAGAAVVSSAR